MTEHPWIKKAKIVIIDDSTFSLKLLKSILEKDGFSDIYLFQDPAKAILELFSTDPDLIIIDLFLHGTTALEVVSKMRQNLKTAHIPIIIVSSTDDVDMIHQSLMLGVDDFISKNKDEIEVLIRVKNTLNREFYRKSLLFEQKRLEEDIRLAAQMQKRMLPSELPTIGAYRFNAFFKPYNIASGDFYNVIRVDEDHVFFMMCDVSGHGVGAAMVVVLLDIYTKEFLKNYSLNSAENLHRYVRFINDKVEEEHGSTGTFVASMFGLLNLKTNDLHFILASSPPPIVIKNGKPVCLDSRSSAPVGVIRGHNFRLYKVKFDFEAMIVFTDGVYEISKPDTHDMMDIPGFLEIIGSVLKNKKLTLSAVFNRIAYEYKYNFEDDITMLMIEKDPD